MKQWKTSFLPGARFLRAHRCTGCRLLALTEHEFAKTRECLSRDTSEDTLGCFSLGAISEERDVWFLGGSFLLSSAGVVATRRMCDGVRIGLGTDGGWRSDGIAEGSKVLQSQRSNISKQSCAIRYLHSVHLEDRFLGRHSCTRSFADAASVPHPEAISAGS